ncbi:MAG: glutamate--tRNA ligase [Candidatus Zophobacter franzmannii]|nr:glutamate--tRNA ligase [Candidatus Zophobacter franzmannii]
MTSDIRVRFAPSPTGFLHLGGLRVALYNYAFAKQNNGTFILRIEDTDQARLVEGAVENLISSLQTMGIDYDEGPGKDGEYGPYFQSQRLDIYKKYIDELVEKGFAYPCFCSRETIDEMRKKAQKEKNFFKYDRRCHKFSKEETQAKIDAGEPHVIRLKMPDERIFTFNDLVRGDVSIDVKQIDDQVILKSDGFPTYHLAAVVDDHLMKISHVFRGEEWLSSTPKHLFLYECFGWTPPLWVHLPLILNTDKSKLSKRKNDVAVETYIEKGYSKEALMNFIALLGWHPSEDRELFSMDEIVKEFSIERVSKAGAVFDITKLEWMSGTYFRSLDLAVVAEYARPVFLEAGLDISDEAKFLRAVEKAREYITTAGEILEHVEMYYRLGELSAEDQEMLDNEESQKVLAHVVERYNTDGIMSDDEINEITKASIGEIGIKGKKFYFPIRLALIGKGHGPDMPSVYNILGKEEFLNRLRNAIK